MTCPTVVAATDGLKDIVSNSEILVGTPSFRGCSEEEG